MSWQLDPDTPPIGRMQTQVLISPSKSYPWYGQIVGCEVVDGLARGGRRFTTQQEHELIKRGADPVTAEAMLVKRQADHNEWYWPSDTLPPVFAFECPVTGHRAGRVKVIAPNGDTKLVLPDGWAHHPYRRPRSRWE